MHRNRKTRIYSYVIRTTTTIWRSKIMRRDYTPCKWLKLLSRSLHKENVFEETSLISISATCSLVFVPSCVQYSASASISNLWKLSANKRSLFSPDVASKSESLPWLRHCISACRGCISMHTIAHARNRGWLRRVGCPTGMICRIAGQLLPSCSPGLSEETHLARQKYFYRAGPWLARLVCDAQ